MPPSALGRTFGVAPPLSTWRQYSPGLTPFYPGLTRPHRHVFRLDRRHDRVDPTAERRPTTASATVRIADEEESAPRIALRARPVGRAGREWASHRSQSCFTCNVANGARHRSSHRSSHLRSRFSGLPMGAHSSRRAVARATLPPWDHAPHVTSRQCAVDTGIKIGTRPCGQDEDRWRGTWRRALKLGLG